MHNLSYTGIRGFSFPFTFFNFENFLFCYPNVATPPSFSNVNITASFCFVLFIPDIFYYRILLFFTWYTFMRPVCFGLAVANRFLE
ncbi:MAG: hypothetical protein A2275_14285 [Bacteroidetes bacterium RIFOXYA12_FULL_35_11]|nr:MAG: hypothetical protein A2X01_12315 [Bacteroidetes bacterium GWF2_35_48]OFY76480.1 MAG: hypothetical protein A2275_14285 [Bacteroidetes bacterium RIFOXYA12_FULL_35_11]OFY95171.1 MAG: hypothetical protein A2309_05345 [Bacteroidetes bacterium RIFOXYB2_FULL_35_7]OFZ01958.1 MAG: hypothetical protein A2491_19790 [Bacteroidetes bacterium RIFOXYC12_FULL_35_7]HBX51087.1 hypothetical protein [Bacteroidales bacterium]